VITDQQADEISWAYIERLIRSRRHSKVNLTLAVLNGWSDREFSHWLETGEEPAGKEIFA